jgi:twitching motility protein PilU
MEAAIAFAETGHLCLATLHSNNADQTIERILNFFPESAHKNVLMNALNLRAVISQRLVKGKDGRRLPATEVLINTPMIRDLLRRGQVHEIKAAMEGAGGRHGELRPVPVPAGQGRHHRAGGSAARRRLARWPGAEVPPVRRQQRRARPVRADFSAGAPSITHGF